jgi:hypothetical protein
MYKLIFFLTCITVSAAPAAATGISATYTIETAGIKIVDATAEINLSENVYTVKVAYRTRGVAAVFFHGSQVTEADGLWLGLMPAPVHFRTVGIWQGINRHTQIDYMNGQPVVSVLEPAESEKRYPVSLAQRADTIDPLSALALLVRQVRDTGRCDGKVSLFGGRSRLEFAAHTIGIEHIDGGTQSWSGNALRCTFESRIVAGFGRERRTEKAEGTKGGVAWIAAPLPGGLPIPVRIDAASRWYGSTSIRLVHADPQ